MNITSAKYLQFENENVAVETIIDDVTMSVPMDPANRHYAEILRQVEEGTLTIEPADETE